MLTDSRQNLLPSRPRGRASRLSGFRLHGNDGGKICHDATVTFSRIIPPQNFSCRRDCSLFKYCWQFIPHLV